MRIRQIAIVFVCVLLAGCGSVTTKYPIGMTAGLSPDPGLIGPWKGPFLNESSDKKGPEAYLHFLKIKGHGAMIAIWVATRMNDEGEGGAMLFQITTGKVGENRFINAVEMDADNKPVRTGSTPALYRYDKSGNLHVFYLDESKAIEAIRSGRIAGVITPHGGKDSIGYYEDVQITAEPAALDAFMARPEAVDLFEEKTVLRKVD